MTTLNDLLAELTPPRRTAIAVCHRAGVLTRSNGKWRGRPSDPIVNAYVVATLTRDGLLDSDRRPSVIGRATLTPKGELIAVAIANAVSDAHEDPA